MAGTLLQTISKDQFERARLLSRRKFINDIESDRNVAKEEEKIEIARKLLSRGLKMEYIAEDTGLPITTIQELAQSIQSQQ